MVLNYSPSYPDGSYEYLSPGEENDFFNSTIIPGEEQPRGIKLAGETQQQFNPIMPQPGQFNPIMPPDAPIMPQPGQFNSMMNTTQPGQFNSMMNTNGDDVTIYGVPEGGLDYLYKTLDNLQEGLGNLSAALWAEAKVADGRLSDASVHRNKLQQRVTEVENALNEVKKAKKAKSAHHPMIISAVIILILLIIMGYYFTSNKKLF